jgi:hypothetical protein
MVHLQSDQKGKPVSWFDPATRPIEMAEKELPPLTKDKVEEDSKKIQAEIDKAMKGNG